MTLLQLMTPVPNTLDQFQVLDSNNLHSTKEDVIWAFMKNREQSVFSSMQYYQTSSSYAGRSKDVTSIV